MIFSKMREMLRGKEIMIEESKSMIETPKSAPDVKPTFKKKRDIFRFQGEKEMSFNLEHVTNIDVKGKRITFQFYSTSTFVDMDDEASALKTYEQIIKIWSVDVVE